MGKQTDLAALVQQKSTEVDKLRADLRGILASVKDRVKRSSLEIEENDPEDDIETLNTLLDYLEEDLPKLIQPLLQTETKKKNRPSKKKRMRMRKRALAEL
jgi:hypothetical protein